MKDRLNRWKEMVAAGNPNAEQYLKQITAQAKAEGKIDEMSEAAQFLMDSASRTLQAVEAGMNEYTVRQKMGTLTEAVNLAYIARRYFGKSRQWLYQRINSQTVNGKPAKFTPDEEKRFRAALSDIGTEIMAFAGRV